MALQIGDNLPVGMAAVAMPLPQIETMKSWGGTVVDEWHYKYGDNLSLGSKTAVAMPLPKIESRRNLPHWSLLLCRQDFLVNSCSTKKCVNYVNQIGSKPRKFQQDNVHRKM